MNQFARRALLPIAAVLAGAAVLTAASPPAAAVGLGLIAVAAAAAGTWRHGRWHGAAWRRAWWLLTAALAGSVAAAIAGLAATPGHYPTGAEPVAALAVAATGAGLVGLFRERLPGRAADTVLGGLTLSLAVGLALSSAWAAHDAGGGVGVAAKLVALAFPLLDLILVWLAIRVMVLTERHPPAYRYLLAALVGLATVHTVTAAAVLSGWSPPGRGLTTVTVWSFLLWAAAAVHPSLRLAFDPVPSDVRRPAMGRILATAAGLTLGPAVILLEAGRGPAMRLPVVLAAATVVPLLVVLRLAAQVRDRVGAEYRAQHDPLTGLPNQVLFHDRLEVALAQSRRADSPLSLIVLDLDRFKGINDSLGHTAGNQVLRAVAQRVRQSIREQDTVARLGGDEFVVLLPGVDASGAETVAEKLLATFGKPFLARGRDLMVTASLGIAVAPGDGADAEALVKHADTAMYQAKAKGRQGWQRYQSQMSARAGVKLAVESGLRQAIERSELDLHFQPKVDLRTLRIVGFEALVRWRHPKLGLVSPEAFIPVAEDSGLIVPLGEWVLQAACQQNRRWADQGLALPVAVNLSAHQFEGPRVEDLVSRVLAETGLPPGLLELEITESVFMRDLRATSASLAALQEMGVRCFLDDFGTGFSGLNYLAEMPIDALKIDRSFVARIQDRGDEAPIVTAIIALAHSLRMEVVAEGVETEEQADFLRDHGCEQMQGFLVSHPLPAGELEPLLRRQRDVLDPLAGAPERRLTLPRAPSPLAAALLLLCTEGEQPGPPDDHTVTAILNALQDDDRVVSMGNRLWRSAGVRAATGTMVGLVPLISGLAAADALPGGAQSTVTAVLARVGVEVPKAPLARRGPTLGGREAKPGATAPSPSGAASPAPVGQDRGGNQPAGAGPVWPGQEAAGGSPPGIGVGQPAAGGGPGGAPGSRPGGSPAVSPVRPGHPLGGGPGHATGEGAPTTDPVHPPGGTPGQDRGPGGSSPGTGQEDGPGNDQSSGQADPGGGGDTGDGQDGPPPGGPSGAEQAGQSGAAPKDKGKG